MCQRLEAIDKYYYNLQYNECKREVSINIKYICIRIYIYINKVYIFMNYEI